MTDFLLQTAGPNINTPNIKERLFPDLSLWALGNSKALTKFRLAYFSLLLCGRAWELLTNSLGWDFISEIGLVQAAMKVVDKISKKVMLNFIVSTETFVFSDQTHWLIDSFDSLILYRPSYRCDHVYNEIVELENYSMDFYLSQESVIRVTGLKSGWTCSLKLTKAFFLP